MRVTALAAVFVLFGAAEGLAQSQETTATVGVTLTVPDQFHIEVSEGSAVTFSSAGLKTDQPFETISSTDRTTLVHASTRTHKITLTALETFGWAGTDAAENQAKPISDLLVLVDDAVEGVGVAHDGTVIASAIAPGFYGSADGADGEAIEIGYEMIARWNDTAGNYTATLTFTIAAD